MRHALLLLVVFATWNFSAENSGEAISNRIRQSWIAIDEAICRQELVEGKRFEVAVDYALSEGPAATLTLSGHGPWIDLPDGKYETTRHHVEYGGLYAAVEVKPGRGRQVFTFTVPKLHGADALLWVANFSDGGKSWPWEVRQGCGQLRRADPPLTLRGTTPGNLFTYAEPVRFTLGFGTQTVSGTSVTAAWKVIGRDGAAVAEGQQVITVPALGKTSPLEIPCAHRGVFGLVITVSGAGAGAGAAQANSIETTFARIPDVLAITKNEPTRFGLHAVLGTATDAEIDARMLAARRLGLTFCRQFVSWKQLEPARGEWRLDGLSHALDKGKEHGIAAMLCVTDPPAWAMQRRAAAGYEPFAFDEAGWSDAISTMTRRFKGRIAAWEWLNEIVPGPEADPIPTYLAMVRLGNAAAKAEDPQVLSVMAGGLWPRSFRLGLLTAGIAKYLDVLPIHYGSADGISEATADLAAVSAGQVQVWDDETAKGVSTWKMPLNEALARNEQCAWAMSQFPGELAAGAQRILWFGGAGDAAGNWDYCWSNGSPRPVAATLAVLTSKLHNAKSQGSFKIGDSGFFHLFAVNGTAVLVAPSTASVVRLRVGSAAVIISDDQGDESPLATKDHDAELPPSELPIFVEGGDLDVLRGYTAPELLTSQISLLAGRDEHLRLRLTNRSDHPLTCTTSTDVPVGWPAVAPVAVTLAAGKSALVELAITALAGSPAGEHALAITCHYGDARMPEVQLPWKLSIIDPKQLGNLLVDGDFEGAKHSNWGLDPTSRFEPAAEGFPHGLGSNVLHMGGSDAWQSAGQSLTLVPGRSYLYSAWVRVTDKQAGSNLDQRLTNGSTKSLYIPQVFSTANTPGWQLLTKLYRAPDDLLSARFTPVAKGSGDAFFDNLRVTVYDGSSFAAEAVHVAKPPVIDGDLSEWSGGCPIPLLGPGQTTILDPTWKPGAANLRAVAKLTWDDKNLYLAAWVDDDVHAAPETGERCLDSDSVVVALHPALRTPGSDAKAFAYYLSPAAPGGGSGKNTLYRPAEHSGGLPSGQLAKDSSVYELAIRRDGTHTCYEVRLPWSQLGTTGRLGAKLGCSLQLNDNDGKGRAAYITWGDGLSPTWNPAAFGILTLIE